MKFDLNKNDLIRLFLIVSFPIHVWWMVMIFRDVNWIAERTTASDSIGFAAYGLMYALVESIFSYLVVLAASFFLPAGWAKTKRINLLGLLIFGLAFWFIMEQVVQIYGPSRMRPIVEFFSHLPNPLLAFDLITWLLVVVSFVAPAVLVVRKENLDTWLTNVFDRLMILSGLYLFFDLAGILLVILRNQNG